MSPGGFGPGSAGAPEHPTQAAVEAFIDALNRSDPDEIAARVTPDFFNEHTSVLGHSGHGRHEYRSRLPTFLSQFEDLRYEVEDLVVDGHRAALRYRMTFRWTEGRQSRPVAIRGSFWFVVRDGLVAHRIDYWDSAAFERQVHDSPR